MQSRWQLAAFFFLVAIVPHAAAQGIGPDRDIGVQSHNGQLVVGLADLDANTFTFPQRVFTRGLVPPGPFNDGPLGLDPGFFTLGPNSITTLRGAGRIIEDPMSPIEGIPSGAVMWDFLPITVGSQRSNLLFWDGSDLLEDGLDIDDVQFSPSSGVEFEVNFNGGTGSGSGSATVTGEDAIVPGASVGLGPSIHSHAFLQFAPEAFGQSVPEGLYLTAWQFRQQANDPSEQLSPSEPVFLILRTSTIDVATEALAAAWVQDNIEELLVPPGLPGDFNLDDFVTGADYTLLRDGVVDGDLAENFQLFTENFGAGLPAEVSGVLDIQAVPEPATLGLALFVIVGVRRRHRLP